MGSVDYEILRRIVQFNESRANVFLDFFGCALAHFDVVGTFHVVDDIIGDVIACYLDRLVGYNAA